MWALILHVVVQYYELKINKCFTFKVLQFPPTTLMWANETFY